MREKINVGVWCGNLKEGDHLEDQGKDERIIFNSI